MILSKPDILNRLAAGRLNGPGGIKLDPEPEESSVGTVSVDLRLGRKFTTFAIPEHIAAIKVRPSLFASDELWARHKDQDHFDLEPGEFVLAQTLETVTIPNDLMGMVEGRSSWARLGLSVHLSAPKIDPGFVGPITLEFANVGAAPIRLEAEQDMPAQLLFIALSQPLDAADLYGASEHDIFQAQTDPIPRGT